MLAKCGLVDAVVDAKVNQEVNQKFYGSPDKLGGAVFSHIKVSFNPHLHK